MNADSEQMRVVYEGAVKLNPSDVEAVQFLAVWHLERHSFQQARKYFGHLATLKQFDADVWLCLSVCCAMAEEFAECLTALKTAQNLIPSSEDDVRVKFCNALMSEKRKDYTIAMEGYVTCLNQCAAVSQAQAQEDAARASASGENNNGNNAWGDGSSSSGAQGGSSSGQQQQQQKLVFMKELRGEVMLRIAVLKKEMGAIDQSMQMCNTISGEPFGDSIRANALCLKGLLHEMRAEFPASEVVYRSVLQITSGHSTALERLGRVYLRYRETIPAAVQCFFKSVETNPSNHVAWYLLGRCYMATSQYSDACEAYNRAVNLNPNDPQVWCSLGVLYYAFGQYREALGMLARALKLDSSMADAWYNVGALYDMCDQPEDAQQAYLKAKENGLADRFARAGMGLNPLAMQSLQYITSNTGSSAAGSGTGMGAGTVGTNSGGGNGHVGSSAQAAAAPGASTEAVNTSSSSGANMVVNNTSSSHSGGSGRTAKASSSERKQQLHQQQVLAQHQALQQHHMQQAQLKQLQHQQHVLYQQQHQQQQAFHQAQQIAMQQQHMQHAHLQQAGGGGAHMGASEQSAQLQQQLQQQQQMQYQQQYQQQMQAHMQAQQAQGHHYAAPDASGVHSQGVHHSPAQGTGVVPLSFAQAQGAFAAEAAQNAPAPARAGDGAFHGSGSSSSSSSSGGHYGHGASGHF